MGPETGLIIFQSIFFYVEENKEMHRGLVFEFKYDDSIIFFVWTILLRTHHNPGSHI